MTALLGGLYEYDAAKRQIELMPTAQVLRFIGKETSGKNIFFYQDEEISIFFPVLKIALQHNAYGYLVDLNKIELDTKPIPYGLWRRLTFFLLDAFTVFALANNPVLPRYAQTEIVGVWANAVWKEDFALQSRAVNHGGAKIFTSTITPYLLSSIQLFPLTSVPMKWHYNAPEKIENSCEIIAEKTLSIEDVIEQISYVPSFTREEKKATLFLHKIKSILHRGEDYMEIPYYGYANANYVFYIRASPPYGVDTFSDWIVLNHDAREHDWQKNDDNKLSHMGFYTSPRYIKEELFFALCDINAVKIDNEMPTIKPDALSESLAERYNQFYKTPIRTGTIFGSFLNVVDGLPYAFCLGMNRLNILPKSYLYAVLGGERRYRNPKEEWAKAHELLRKLIADSKD